MRGLTGWRRGEGGSTVHMREEGLERWENGTGKGMRNEGIYRRDEE